MSANDLMVKISELPPLDYHDSSSLMAVVGRDRNSTGTGKVTIRKLRSTFDFSSAFVDLPAGIAGTLNGESFFVYTDLSKSFVNEYINVSGSPSPVQDPVEGTIFYPTRYGIVNAMASGVTATSFANLRKTRPAKNGASIYLTGYRDNETTGAGEFTGFLGTGKTDDGGMVAVGAGFYWVRKTEVASPEMFGAYGDGKNDDTGAIQRAMDTGLDVVFDKDGVYLVPRTLVFAWNPGKQTLDGRGCTINYTDKSKGLFNQYNSRGEITRYTINRNFKNFTLNGPATKDSAWLSVSSCDGIALQDGYVENVRFFGWCNATRGHGNAYIRNCYADNLRVAMFSCYDPGYNEIVDCDIGWCAGDGLILKGASAKAHNITFEYAGCITKNNEDGPEALPGCIFSAGADGEAAATQKIQISNISCKYYGCAGINLQGDGISISGNMSLGSVYEGNFVAKHQAAAMWLGCKNFSIGDIYFEKVHIGLGINGSANNGTVGKFVVRSKTNLAGSTLLSITDSPTSNISAVTVDSFEFYGSSTINNDVYLNTEGLNLKYLYIQSLNNAQGGFTVSIRKACRIGKMILAATTSSATNPVMLVEADAVIDHLEFRRVFGTALTVDNAKPIINKLTMPMKQGIMPPIVIKGDGSLNLYWGDVDINGPGIRWPILNGKLTMTSYQGPNWRVNDVASYAGVSYPGRSADFVGELRLVGPVKDDDVIELKSYVLGLGVGGGKFIGKLIPGTDDSGLTIVGNGFSWLRKLEDRRVNVEHFGAIGDYGRLTLKGTDSTVPLANAAAAARSTGYSLFFPVTKNNEGYYTTKMLSLTNILNILGDSIRIYVASDKFEKSSGEYALCWGNPDTDYKDITGWPNIADIHVEDVSKRASPLNGIFFKFTGGNIGRISARAFNGAGYQLAPVFDSVFAGLVTERCGNETVYAHYWRGNGDETNTITVNNILCHDSYHKGVSINGSKHNIQRVHIEATATLVTDDGYTGSSKSGLSYLNHQFYLVAGTVGDLTINDYRRSTNKTYYGDRDALDVGSHTRLVLDLASSVSTATSSSVKSIISTFGGTNMYGFIGALSTDVYHAEPSARVNIGTIAIKDSAFIWESSHKISFGRIKNLKVSAGILESVTLSDPYVATPNATTSTTFNGCTFTSGITGLCTGYGYFNDCHISSISINSPNTPERARFNNCIVSGDTLIDGVKATVNSKNILFSGSRFTGNVTIQNIKNDGPRFTGQSICFGTVTGWTAPNGVPPGTLCERIGLAEVGDGLVYYCSKLDQTTSISTWVPVVKRDV